MERVGAIGDNIVITPLIHYLKEQGNEIYLLTSMESGAYVFANNPYVDKIIHYAKESVPIGLFLDFCKSLKDGYECDRVINMSESLEVSLLKYPTDPVYMWPKQERIALCDKNVYDYAFIHAGYKDIKGRGRGELYFTEEEQQELITKFPFLSKRGRHGQYLLLWGLAGSGRNKFYPQAESIQMELLKKYTELVIITTGDEACQVLETAGHPRLIHISGQTTVREMIMLPKFVNLVICPDTGLLHSAGCFSTPKIGLLGHDTREHISKYYENDYSLEAQVDCAPCYRLVTHGDIQCPIDPLTRATWCMRYGFDIKETYNHICNVIEKAGYYEERKTVRDRDIIQPGFTKPRQTTKLA